MQTILIAEDYTDQHKLLQQQLAEAGIPYHICRNTALDISLDLACGETSLVVLNASKLGSDTIRKLCERTDRRVRPCDLINIYTYEDSEELAQLRITGVTENLPFPYSPKSLISYIRSRLEQSERELKLFIRRTAERIAEMTMQFCPPCKQRGIIYIREAVLHVLFCTDQTFTLHNDIYTRIAKKHSTSVKSVEHSIRITISSCWDNADSKMLQMLAGCTDNVSKRPTNACFISALAHLIADKYTGYYPGLSSAFLNSTYPKLHI